jgi:hypothetical protein
MSRNIRLDAHYSAGSYLITKEYCPISFQLSLPFGHSVLTTSAVSHGFTYVHHTDTLALTRLWLSGGTSSHDSVPIRHKAEYCYIVRLAALFRVLGQMVHSYRGEQRFIRLQVARTEMG